MDETWGTLVAVIVGGALTFLGGVVANRWESRNRARLEMLTVTPLIHDAVTNWRMGGSEEAIEEILVEQTRRLQRIAALGRQQEWRYTQAIIEELHDLQLILFSAAGSDDSLRERQMSFRGT